MDAAFGNLQFFRVEEDAVCLLLELKTDLNGSIVCECLGVKIENCEIIVHWLDTM